MDEVKNIEQTNYSTSCRICLNVVKLLISLTDNYFQSVPFLNLIYECTGLILRETNLCPMKICRGCERELLSAIQFKRKCLETEKLLVNFEQSLNQSGGDDDNKASLAIKESSANTEIPNIEVINVFVKDEPSETFIHENTFDGANQSNDALEDEKRVLCFADKPTDISEILDLASISVRSKNESTFSALSVSIKEEPKSKQMGIITEIESGNQIEIKSGGIRKDKQKRKNIEKKRWECKFCVKTFLNQPKYIRHQNSSRCKGKLETYFKCEECKQVLKNRSRYEIHIAKSHFSLCPYCGKMISNHAFPTHIESHENKIANIKPYKCDECDRVFSMKAFLNRHKRLHTNDKPYECKYCHEKFVHWNTRRVHMHKVHLKKDIFQCKYCEKSFNINVLFLNHVRSMHTLEYRHECDICEKKFVRKAQLNKHKISHSDVKNFKCDICEKTFKMKRYLQTHMMIHTGEKNYICPVCALAFTQNHVMKTHILRFHPGTEIPPAGTIVSKKAVKKMQEEEEVDHK